MSRKPLHLFRAKRSTRACSLNVALDYNSAASQFSPFSLDQIPSWLASRPYVPSCLLNWTTGSTSIENFPHSTVTVVSPVLTIGLRSGKVTLTTYLAKTGPTVWAYKCCVRSYSRIFCIPFCQFLYKHRRCLKQIPVDLKQSQASFLTHLTV